LFGLLGTVSGMVQVFDVIAVTGSSDAKAMAGGIFKATLPTMSGLFLAVSALYFHYLLTQRAKAIQLRARELADEC
jgi:biopolymer transport protein ExbB